MAQYKVYKNTLAIHSEEKALWTEFVLALKLLSSKPKTFETENIKLPTLFPTLCFNTDQCLILSKTCFGSFL